MTSKLDSIDREVPAFEQLCAEFEGVFAPETIERYLSESMGTTGARRPLLPLFARRFARERLRALAQSEGRLKKDVPEVLFVCVNNAGRSQMAAALLRARAGDRVHVRTSGSEPAEQLYPNVVEAMREVGLDLGQEFPKPLSDEFVAAADVVVTMGCGDACPILPGKVYADWDLPDPAGQDLDVVRGIRDLVAERVDELLAELEVGGEG